MSHHHPRADASASGLSRPHRSDGPPSPRRASAEPTELPEAMLVPPGAPSYPAIGARGEHPMAAAAGIPSAHHAARPGGATATGPVHPATGGPEADPGLPDVAIPAQAADENPFLPVAGRVRAVRSWPLLVLALPAMVAVWSGWVGIGQMTGFGQVHPLPGIWDSLHIDTAITLPIGVEAYAAYALRAWLSASAVVSAQTRWFARASAIGSLLLGMAGQIAYHLLAQARTAQAPWGITTAVSCLPVLVLGMGAALAHLLRADSCRTNLGGQAGSTHPDQAAGKDTRADHTAIPIRPERLAQAWATATTLNAAGQRVSRRSLRGAGVRGSNAELGAVARLVTTQLASQGQ